MCEAGGDGSETFKDEDVLEGVGQVVLPADDVGDAEVGVVKAGGQVVGGVAVRAEEREVFDFIGGLGISP